MQYSDGPNSDEEAAGFQAGGSAWDPRRSDIMSLLESATHAEIQPIYYGSNHTFLVTLDAGPAGRSYSVYKPARGEYPLYDFPIGTLYRREVATWLVDCLLGWRLVPPTVEAEGDYGIGSLQLFIEGRSEGQLDIEEIQRLSLLDVLANNADRKAEHCLLGQDGTLWGIDHGLTFHAQPKLRTVLWHFAGKPLPASARTDLARLDGTLQSLDVAEAELLSQLIARYEMTALRRRLDRLLEGGIFPDPRYKPVPYRW